MKDFAKILKEQGVSFVEKSSGELILDRCPSCGKAKKFYVRRSHGLFDCKSCNIQGNGVELLTRLLGISFKAAKRLITGEEWVVVGERPSSQETYIKAPLTGFRTKYFYDRPKLTPLRFEPGMRPIGEEDGEAKDYLLGRGVSLELQKMLNIQHWPFMKRVVFPVTIEGELYGYLSRDYSGEAEYKVLNAPGPWRSLTVWNYDNVIGTETLVIAEGAFSAIKCGVTRSIALMGKKMSDGQADLVRSLEPKRIVLALDVGTESEKAKIFSQLVTSFPGQIYSVAFPHVKSIRCSKCGKKTDRTEKEKQAACVCGHSMSQIEAAKAWKSAEFKDAGDYSEAEMEKMIQEAKKYEGRTLFS